MSYQGNELGKLSPNPDIRGIRLYMVGGIEAGREGGGEFHRIRSECILVLSGMVEWQCEDLYGVKTKHVLNSDCGVFTPPFILHRYRALERSSMLVLCNTLFDPDNYQTQDTYPNDVFYSLQERYRTLHT